MKQIFIALAFFICVTALAQNGSGTGSYGSVGSGNINAQLISGKTSQLDMYGKLHSTRTPDLAPVQQTNFTKQANYEAFPSRVISPDGSKRAVFRFSCTNGSAANHSVIYEAISYDYGASYGTDIVVVTNVVDVENYSPGVGPDGTLYVVYTLFDGSISTPYFIKSTDWTNFTSPVLISTNGISTTDGVFLTTTAYITVLGNTLKCGAYGTSTNGWHCSYELDSYDLGATWTNYLIYKTNNCVEPTIVVYDTKREFCTTRGSSSGAAVFESTNSGVTWFMGPSTIPTPATAIGGGGTAWAMGACLTSDGRFVLIDGVRGPTNVFYVYMSVANAEAVFQNPLVLTNWVSTGLAVATNTYGGLDGGYATGYENNGIVEFAYYYSGTTNGAPFTNSTVFLGTYTLPQIATNLIAQNLVNLNLSVNNDYIYITNNGVVWPIKVKFSPENIIGTELFLSYLDLPFASTLAPNWTNRVGSQVFTNKGTTFPTNSANGMVFDGTTGNYYLNGQSNNVNSIRWNLQTDTIWICFTLQAIAHQYDAIWGTIDPGGAGAYATTGSGGQFYFMYAANVFPMVTNVQYDVLIGPTSFAGSTITCYTNGVLATTSATMGNNTTYQYIYGLGQDALPDTDAKMTLKYFQVLTNTLPSTMPIARLHSYALTNSIP